MLKGWISTDEDEIKRRQWRGRTEIDEVRALDDSPGPFCDYRVTSSSGHPYLVEVRSFRERINSCDCRDYRTNRLGTCKHIEGALHRIGTRRRDSNGRIEVFLDERDGRELRISVPEQAAHQNPMLVEEARRLCRKLHRGSFKALRALREAARSNAGSLRVSRRLESWLEARRAALRKQRDRNRFVADLDAGRRSLDNLLKRPLLPYQVEGVLHLAFGERALLADDMGLGKTVQAIAACALLRELRGIECVLVVSPASLKAEWEEQIAMFSGLPATLVSGNPTMRRIAYERRTFFTLCNYEQVLAEGDRLLATLRPDVVILDEAQRIKNWQTKTAGAVKKLDSQYAFVLTGTPLENRIDEIYSIVQFLEPELLGPLFRFNREFYELDAKGRPIGYQNLAELAERLSSVMLRRRKEDVETQLPGRTTKTFFVPMTATQTSFYRDYESLAARLASMAERRPLTKEEFEQLQRYLACMRMVCDTPYILDDKPYECPKIDEIERLLPDLLEDPERKIIVFSEWVRMLGLVREYAVQAAVEFAWHTGSVPPQRRRAEIHRFREDPDCRLFLSSESGGVGLNLQAADTVINMDLPWNPTRLEQRIARAWRKHQTRPVTAINLVSENTIEHRMLGLLDQKRALADAVIDRRGDLSKVRLPTSRAAFLERLNQVLDSAPRATEDEQPPLAVIDKLRDDLVAEHGAALHRIFARADEGAVLVVVSLPPDRTAEEERRLAQIEDLEVNVIDQVTHEAMLRLAKTGMISLPTEALREVYPGSASAAAESEGQILRATALVDRGTHKLKVATLLEGGGFAEEAQAPAAEAACLAVGALAALRGEPEPEDPESAAAFLLRSGLEEIRGEQPHGAIGVLSGEPGEEGAAAPVKTLVSWVADLIGASRGSGSTGPARRSWRPNDATTGYGISSVKPDTSISASAT